MTFDKDCKTAADAIYKGCFPDGERALKTLHVTTNGDDAKKALESVKSLIEDRIRGKLKTSTSMRQVNRENISISDAKEEVGELKEALTQSLKDLGKDKMKKADQEVLNLIGIKGVNADSVKETAKKYKINVCEYVAQCVLRCVVADILNEPIRGSYIIGSDKEVTPETLQEALKFSDSDCVEVTADELQKVLGNG